MALMPRESGKLISQLAKSVFIEEQGVKKIASLVFEGLKDGTVSIDNFSASNQAPDANPVDWIFMLNTLNFSFWGNNFWEVNGQSGYFALCAAMKRAIEAGIPIYDPKYYSKIERKELENILRPDENYAEIPMIAERINNLHQVGRILNEKFNSSFLECIKQCNKSAEKLLKLIVEEFECYRDEASFHGYKVSFYKRAQILVGDIWAHFKGKGLGEFHDIGVITMFADYRVPQVLIHFGAMRYTEFLHNKLKSEEIQAFSDEEIEIRGCSIEGVEQILAEVKKMIHENSALSFKDSDINSIVIDHFLWDYRRAHAEELESIPYHKTRTIYY